MLRLRPPPNVRAKPLAAMSYTLTFNISILNTLPQGFIVAHFASKVSYSAAPHASPLYQSCFFLFLNTLPQGFIKSRPYQCKYLPERSAKTKIQNEDQKQKLETNKALQRTKKAPRPTSRGAFFIDKLHCFPVSVTGRQERKD